MTPITFNEAPAVPARRFPETLIRADLSLVGVDGNAFSIMGAVQRALRRAGNTPDDVAAVLAEMRSGDYDHLLQTAIAVTA